MSDSSLHFTDTGKCTGRSTEGIHATIEAMRGRALSGGSMRNRTYIGFERSLPPGQVRL